MELSEIGYFSKTLGIKGQLVLKASADFDVEALKAVFIERGGSKAPYFIKELREGGHGFVLTLEDLDTVEKAKVLVNSKVFVDASLVYEEEDPELLGYEVMDARLGSLGAVNDIFDNGQQVLLSLEYKGKEVLLPLVEEFIERVDEGKKQIFYKGPEGLVELYLDEAGTPDDGQDGEMEEDEKNH